MPRSSSRSSSSGRSSGGGGMFGGGSRSSAAPTRSSAPPKAESRPAPSANVPATVHSTPSVPAVASTGSRPGGLMGTIMEGMAFGTGSAIAHRAVGAIAGSFGGGAAATQSNDNTNATPQQTAPNSNVNYASHGQDCASFQQEFVRCLQENKNDIASCQMFMDNFTQCQKDNRLM